MKRNQLHLFSAFTLALGALGAVVGGAAVASSTGGEVTMPVRAQVTEPMTYTVYVPLASRNYVDLSRGHPGYECYFAGYEHSVNSPRQNGDIAFPCLLAGVEAGWHYVSDLEFPEGYNPGPNPPSDWWKFGADDDYYNNYAGASDGQVFTATVTPPDGLYVFLYYQEEGKGALEAAVPSYPGEPVTLTYTIHLYNGQGEPIEHWVIATGRPLRPQDTPPGEDYDTFYNWSNHPYCIEFSEGPTNP